MLRMISKALTILLAATVLSSAAALLNLPTPSDDVPKYTADDQLKFPENYRRWTYLTTGFDMSYNPAMSGMDHHMFDNVFVNPDAYNSFLDTGTWPDKTMLVLEGRKAEGKGSINQNGNYQSSEVMGVEAHVKDEAHGKWAFYIFDKDKTAKLVDRSMACYSCHAEHASVDTTFVQFYPTLLPIARSRGTLSPSYLKESAASTQK
jgi:Cytochrome P460